MQVVLTLLTSSFTLVHHGVWCQVCFVWLCMWSSPPYRFVFVFYLRTSLIFSPSLHSCMLSLLYLFFSYLYVYVSKWMVCDKEKNKDKTNSRWRNIWKQHESVELQDADEQEIMFLFMETQYFDALNINDLDIHTIFLCNLCKSVSRVVWQHANLTLRGMHLKLTSANLLLQTRNT